MGAGFALAQPAAVEDRFAPDNTLPLDPKLRKGVLENGLRYYIRENRRPENPRERFEAEVPDHEETLVSIAEDPLTCVALGAGEALREIGTFERVLQD